MSTVHLNRTKNYVKAEECGDTAIEMFTAFGLPPTHPQMQNCLSNMAINREKLGMINDTLAIYREELEMLKTVEPFDAVVVCGKLDEIIQVHKRANHVAEYLLLADEGLAIAQKYLPPNHVTIADLFSYTADANLQLGKDYPAALAAYKAALQIYNTLPEGSVKKGGYITTCVFNIPQLERICADVTRDE